MNQEYSYKFLEKIKPTILDKDSYSIIIDYVKESEKYDTYIKKKIWKPLFNDVLKELSLFFDDESYENILLKDPAIKSVIISENYSKKILDNIKFEKNNYIDEEEWYNLNGYEYYEDCYNENEFMWWFCGASCDI